MKEELRLKIEERHRRKEESLGQTSIKESDVGVLRRSPVQKNNNNSLLEKSVGQNFSKGELILSKSRMTGFISFRCPLELKDWVKTRSKNQISKYLVRILTKIKLNQETKTQ